jgi:hypothetical protein
MLASVEIRGQNFERNLQIGYTFGRQGAWEPIYHPIDVES